MHFRDDAEMITEGKARHPKMRISVSTSKTYLPSIASCEERSSKILTELLSILNQSTLQHHRIIAFTLFHFHASTFPPSPPPND
jgi:hypothetical protein